MHQILFDNVCSGWHNALPLGNGRMGAMVFFESNTLHLAFNHYDCYYQSLSRYGQPSRPSGGAAGEPYQVLCQAVAEAREKWEVSRTHYNYTLHPLPEGRRPQYHGSSHPMAGELLLHLSPQLSGAETQLKLKIEKAEIVFTAKRDGHAVAMTILVPKTSEGVLIALEQSEGGLLKEAELVIPSGRGLAQYPVSAHGGREHLQLDVGIGHGETPVDFVSETVFFAPKGEYQNGRLTFSDQRVQYFSASVRPRDIGALRECRYIWENRESLRAGHCREWKNFWKSRIQIPDTFLETLWYLHLYLTECSSGRGGRHFEQACGLNGLWDIRRPNMWGSMWYWDVNIQEAFWHCFSSNHLELARDFCKAYLRFTSDAEAFARDIYGFSGMAIDHPHPLYHCIHPWCAQFLWRYYTYSGDRDFLERDAYPVFWKQFEFIRQLAKKDAEGIYHIDPDISPEQGPVTRDAVITISVIRHLLYYAVQAAGILNRPQVEADKMLEFMTHLPDYPKTEDGSRWKDSALAPDDLLLRHPSVLMPIFPGEEVCKHSPEAQRETGWNTLRFASEHTEIGVFGYGWIAAAAARMGEGGSALRILYEKGLDHCLHSNGMAYEESERWINFCVVTKPPLYWPAMMESSGGIPAAVDEMLIQSVQGVLEVFPAVPDGKDGLAVHKTMYLHDDAQLQGKYPAWENCRFQGLLSEGGFSVDAEMQSGKVCFVKIKSTRNAHLSFRLPEALRRDEMPEILERDMAAGEELQFGAESMWEEKPEAGVLLHEAAVTHRRIFLGENQDTSFYQAVDSFVCPFEFANILRPQWTSLVLDIGDSSISKVYNDVYAKESCLVGENIVYATGPRQLSEKYFSPDIGYGFGKSSISIVDRGKPDSLRRDFAEGSSPAEFWLELPKGKYDFLLISGDDEEESATRLTLPQYGAAFGGERIAKGRYQSAVIPVVHTKDGIFRIRLESVPGCKWKLNAIFLNKDHMLV